MPHPRVARLVRHLLPAIIAWTAIVTAGEARALARDGAYVVAQPSATGTTTIDAMTRDSAGSTFILGSFTGSTLTIGTAQLTKSTTSTRDIFVAKLNADGTTAWARGFGNNTGTGRVTPSAQAIAVDAAGNSYLVGYYTGTFADLSLGSLGSQSGFVTRLDATGSLVWATELRAVDAQFSDIAVDSTAQAVFVAGSAGSSVTLSPLMPTTTIGRFDGVLARLRQDNGAGEWIRHVGGNGTVSVTSRIALDPASQSLLATTEFNGGNLTSPAATLRGSRDLAVIKLAYDGTGGTTIQSFSGSNAMLQSGGLAVDGAGAVYLAGIFNGGITAPVPLGAVGNYTGFIGKLTLDGTVTWATRFGGLGGNVTVRSIGLDAASRPFVTGSIAYSGLTEPAAAALSRIGTEDGFVLSADSGGTINWARNFGGAGANIMAGGGAIDADGNIYVAASFTDAGLTQPTAPLTGTRAAVVIGDVVPRRTLTIASPSNGTVRDGGGDLVCGTSCSASYTAGTSVTLTATPAAGYVFAGWTGDCTGTDNPLTFTINATRSCAATFSLATAGGGNSNTPAPSVPATPPAFVTTPVPLTLDAATVGTGTGSVSFASAFANPSALAFSVASASTTPLPAWLSFDPASVSFSYNVPLPADLPIQPIADATPDASRTGRADARAAWANTLYPPLIRIAQIPVTLTASGAGQSYASTIRMSFYAPRPRVAVAAISLSQDGAVGNARANRPALSFDAGQVVFQTAATNLFPAAPNTDTDIVRYHALSGTRDRLSQTAIPGGGVANAANGAALNPAVSSDGRFAAFAADASGITLTPSGRVRQVYRTSLAHPRIDLDPATTPAPDFVSATPDGIPGNAPSDKPALSEDGRFVVFESAATNFAQGLDGTRQVWRKDLATGALALVSAAAGPGNAPSGNPAVSWDGRFVAFESAATNLTANPGSATQVYLKDMTSGAIRLVSASAGTPANAAATSPVIAARADRIAFVSAATNLGSQNQAGRNQVLTADLATGRLDLVAADADQPAISADGRFVAFRAAANGIQQIWVRDTARAVTALVTQTAAGTPGTGPSWAPAIAGDAATIAFASDARDLVNGNPAPGQAFIAANPLVLPEKPGYWYMPAIGGGQGWVMERWGDRAYVAGLAYDTNGRSQWLAGFCNLSGLTCSGRLNQGPVFTLETAASGTAATLTVGATAPQTLALFPIGGSATTGFAGLPQTGWWYEPDAGNGVGYFLAVNTQAQANGAVAHVGYLSVLGYDARRQPVWQVAQATLGADLGFSGTLMQYAGGMPFGGASAATASASQIGQVRMTFTGTDRARIALPDGRVATLERFRF